MAENRLSWIFKGELRGPKPIAVFTLVFVLVGGILGYWLLTEEWSDLRRLAAGAAGGLGAASIIVMSRLVGAYSETEE